MGKTLVATQIHSLRAGSSTNVVGWLEDLYNGGSFIL